MATPEDPADDIFQPSGHLRLELWSDSAQEVLRESLRLGHETHWDSVRSPHVFMGLLSVCDEGVRHRGERLGADLPKLLTQFQELFNQDQGDSDALLAPHREFLSDNVIRLLREARQRSIENQRDQITPMDLLISLLTAPNSIIAECFE